MEENSELLAEESDLKRNECTSNYMPLKFTPDVKPPIKGTMYCLPPALLRGTSKVPQAERRQRDDIRHFTYVVSNPQTDRDFSRGSDARV